MTTRRTLVSLIAGGSAAIALRDIARATENPEHQCPDPATTFCGAQGSLKATAVCETRYGVRKHVPCEKRYSSRGGRNRCHRRNEQRHAQLNQCVSDVQATFFAFCVTS